MALLDKHPTYTSQVFDYLVKLDDFASVSIIAKATGVKRKHVATALLMLREYRAVDSTDVQGVLWWCATPEYDRRQRVIKETTTHTRKSRGRVLSQGREERKP